MRVPAILLAALLTLPFVGSLGAAPGALRPSVAPDLGDIPDGELVLLLARYEGIPAGHPPPVQVPPGATLDGLVAKLAARAGAPLHAEDAAAFATLDPRVAAPVTLLLAAVDQAWDLRDRAFARLAPADLARLQALAEARAFDDPAYAPLDAQVDKAALVDAAILLLDTLEGLVLPALQDAIAAGAWPSSAVADPIGILRLGSPGDDVETLDRIVQLDPSGNDRYLNNAGGTTMTLTTSVPKTPIALSVDFAGNDEYTTTRLSPSQGGGGLGVGLLLDLSGNDEYRCRTICLGSSILGVGIARDHSGEDSYAVRDLGIGYGYLIGVARDDEGNDSREAIASSGGASDLPSTFGLLWDRTGIDNYSEMTGAEGNWGISWRGGDAWLIDQGNDTDSYSTAIGPSRHACNDCRWSFGEPSLADGRVHGVGVDNAGSLETALSQAYLN